MAGSVISRFGGFLVPFAAAPVIHIYEHPVDGGIVECMAVLVLKRDHGVLLAIPAGVVSQLELDEGQTATMIADLGPSALVEVGGARLSGTGAVSIPDSLMQVVLLDVGATAAVGRLSLLAQGMEPELLIPFDNGQPDLIPDPDALLARALLWAQGADPGQDRLAFLLCNGRGACSTETGGVALRSGASKGHCSAAGRARLGYLYRRGWTSKTKKGPRPQPWLPNWS